MKALSIISIFILISINSFSQSNDSYPDGWTMVTKDGYVGFIDDSGNEVVKPKYESIGKFGEYHEHWALVSIDAGTKLGFIDDNGNEIVKPKYDTIGRFGKYHEGWALVSVDVGTKYGFIDENGNEVVKPKFETIDDLKSSSINP